MTHIEAMKQWLEALVNAKSKIYSDFQVFKEVETAITSLRQALATEESSATQEPVAMRYDFDGYGYKYIDSGSGSDWQTRIKNAEPVYTHSQRQEKERCSGCEACIDSACGRDECPKGWVKAQPKAEQEPKREPLTDAMWGVLDAVEEELNRRAIPEVWLLMAHKAGSAYIEKQTAAPQQKDTP